VKLAPLALVAALALTGSALAGDSPTVSAASRCLLFGASPEHASTAECQTCHRTAGKVHPVDVVYAQAASAASSGLRPAAEVVKRGVFLPDGKITCLTCHDAHSPWKDHITLPPGAAARQGVVPGQPDTYEEPATGRPAVRGGAVALKPLCTACHTVGD
jgi:hypothetical protein